MDSDDEAQEEDVASKDCRVDVTSRDIDASIDAKRALGPQCKENVADISAAK